MTQHDHPICVTCGTQFGTGGPPPASCPICEDDRQYLPPGGQQWTTLAAMHGEYRNMVTEIEPGLYGIRTEPSFAIGQQALLVRTSAGNLLWDCVSYLDNETVAAVERLGGISAIAVDHPHFHSSMVEWSRAFGNAPIYLHADNESWVMRPDPAIELWTGETRQPLADLTLIRCGGHFPGSAVLHWPTGAGGSGALFTSDTITVVPDSGWVSFMYSYPNLIPLGASAIRRIVAAVEPFYYDRVYGGWPDRIVERNAKAAVRRSAERYIARIGG